MVEVGLCQKMGNFSNHVSVADPWCYLMIALGLSVLVRFSHCLLRSIKINLSPDSEGAYWGHVWQSFRGFPDTNSKNHADYWYTFILGFFELSIYPTLIAASAWTAIGAWFGLKTIAQWKVWSDDRAVFNLFLIGNLINLILAFVVLSPMVRIG